MQNNYYVYTAKVDGVLRYIGIGKGSRDNHCVSGKSSCVELNRSLFNGADNLLEMQEQVKIYLNRLMEEINTEAEKCNCCNGIGYVVNSIKTNSR